MAVRIGTRTRACWAMVAAALVCAWPLRAAELERIPAGPAYAGLAPTKAPAPGPLLLQTGDRLAVVGDSITEQQMYSRLIEDYLTVCVPQLAVTVRQFGWSGETAEGFGRRMESDCLRLKPTVATLCFGMNDYKYRPYDDANAAWYRERYTGVVRGFKAAGARVVVGSAGCVGKVASWVKSATGTLEQHNEHLCKLRNIALEIAAAEQSRFADVFWPQYQAGVNARAKYGPDFNIAGGDGVHPGWAGHLVMAWAYLRALGLDGNLGTITLDLASDRANGSPGHAVEACAKGELTVVSTRYPFILTGDPTKDNSTRGGASLVPFNRELNRLRLVVTGAKPGRYRVTWGTASATFAAGDLAAGINLADAFPDNPFAAAFA
ncbi:MAG: SGNH/GDSL hydrolase family protein, partial [Armatimonadetes bacterium]|nr:SGNH/GDSL hydrolase family protein [Armatimonadota bacterium]